MTLTFTGVRRVVYGTVLLAAVALLIAGYPRFGLTLLGAYWAGDLLGRGMALEAAMRALQKNIDERRGRQ